MPLACVALPTRGAARGGWIALWVGIVLFTVAGVPLNVGALLPLSAAGAFAVLQRNLLLLAALAWSLALWAPRRRASPAPQVAEAAGPA